MSYISNTGFLIYYNKLKKNERIDISIQKSIQLEIYIYADGSQKIRICVEKIYDSDSLYKQIKKISDEIDVISDLENYINNLTDDRIKIVDWLIGDKIILRYHYAAIAIKKIVFFNIKFQYLQIKFERDDYRERLERLEHLLCLMKYYNLEKCYLTIYYKSDLEELQKYLPEGWNLVELSSASSTITCSLEREP